MNLSTFALYLIPFLNALSWLLGGNLVMHLSPLVLSTARTAVVALMLITTQMVLSKKWNVRNTLAFPRRWWVDQSVLALSGRVIYYYYSAKALLTVSPFEAILLTSLLPVFTLFIERLMHRVYLAPLTVLWGGLASVLGATSILLASDGRSTSFQVGHFEMLIAVAGFAFHTIYYKIRVKDKSPVKPLAAQFALSSIAMLPFLDQTSVIQLRSLDFQDGLQFFVYSVICGLLPFVLLHYSLKKFSPFIVMTVSILAPLFAIALKGLYVGAPVNSGFLGLCLLSCAFSYLALRANNRTQVAFSR